MSRIGKLPVEIPAKVEASVDANVFTVKGPKGTLSRSFNSAVKIAIEDKSIVVTPVGSTRIARAMHGTARSIIAGMVFGVVNGYEKNIIINGVGFRANVQGKVLDLALGKSHPIKHPIPDGLTVTVTDQTKVKVQGYDKHMVGEFAAQVKRYYPAEPYKGKGVAIEGEFVRRKEGKKAG